MDFSFQAVIQILRKAYPDKPIEITNKNAEPDQVWVCIIGGRGNGNLVYDFREMCAIMICQDWMRLLEDASSEVMKRQNDEVSSPGIKDSTSALPIDYDIMDESRWCEEAHKNLFSDQNIALH